MTKSYIFIIKNCGSVFACRESKITHILNLHNDKFIEVFNRIRLPYESNKIYNINDELFISDNENNLFKYNHNGCFSLFEIPQSIISIEMISLIDFGNYIFIDDDHVIWYCSNKLVFNKMCLPPALYYNTCFQWTLLLDTDNNLWSVQTEYGYKETKIICYLPKIYKICCGYSHIILLDFEKKLWVMGNNKFGQLGIGNTKNILIFTIIEDNLPPFIDISCGMFHSCATDYEGKIWICGSNIYGQKGITTKFLPIIGLPPIVSVTCSKYNTLTLDSEYFLWSCRHRNYSNNSNNSNN